MAADEFLAALGAGMPKEERLIICAFVGDPNSVGPNAWKPRPWTLGREIDLLTRANAYVTVSSFGQASDTSYRRRAETFRAGRALMVDDVGTKVDPSRVAMLPPSARIETSSGNEQWWYFFREPERDAKKFDDLIKSFIAGSLLGKDPGMSGITRVGRLPGFTNGKPAYNGWITRLHDLNDRRFSIDEIFDAFSLTRLSRTFRPERATPADRAERIAAFYVAFKWLLQRGQLKATEPDMSGWTEMTCPWIEEHTGGADTGAAIREPREENGYYGGFRCHHGHCQEKGWRDLTQWISELAGEELDEAAKLTWEELQARQTGDTLKSKIERRVRREQLNGER